MKLVVAFLASVALAVPAAAQVPADTVDPTVPTQLPRTAVPHHYAITVTPHAERLTFDGDGRHRPRRDQADARTGA